VCKPYRWSISNIMLSRLWPSIHLLISTQRCLKISFATLTNLSFLDSWLFRLQNKESNTNTKTISYNWILVEIKKNSWNISHDEICGRSLKYIVKITSYCIISLIFCINKIYSLPNALCLIGWGRNNKNIFCW
jgi:hypothetical protein